MKKMITSLRRKSLSYAKKSKKNGRIGPLKKNRKKRSDKGQAHDRQKKNSGYALISKKELETLKRRLPIWGKQFGIKL